MKNQMSALPLILICCAFGSGVAANAQDVPELSDYAWGFPIIVERDASFYSIELPLEVNQSVADPELRDTGVYNSAGDPVTRVFQQKGDDVEEAEHLVPLPVLPLSANVENSADAVRMLFEQDGDKTRLEFDSSATPESDNSEQLTAYIVDTRNVNHAIEALEFSWDPVESGFIGRITVDGSNDLQNWDETGFGAVAELSQDDASIVQRRVKLRNTSHDYLRIRWEGMAEDWALSGVQGYYVTGATRNTRKFITLDSGRVDAEDGGRIFDLGGAPQVDRIRVVLTQPDTIISGAIYYWSEHQQRWTHLSSGSHYHIGRGGNVVRSNSIRINKIRSRRFKVVETRGRPGVAMQLEIGWRPDTLTFLAQGNAPFTLATGRAADAAYNFPQEKMYGDRSILGLASGSGRMATAALGPRFALGGTDILSDAEPINWRQLSLWIGLLLGVAFVGFMATKVIRDLKAG